MQQKMDAILKEIRAGQERLKEEILAKIDASQEKMDAWIAEMRTRRKETTAYKDVTEACLESKEPTPLEVGSVAVHEETPKEVAALKTVRALKKWHRDRHLAIRHRGQPKKRIQGNGGSWKKLAVACRGMARRAIPASCWVHCYQGHSYEGK
jgi:hypothetical protein